MRIVRSPSSINLSCACGPGLALAALSLVASCGSAPLAVGSGSGDVSAAPSGTPAIVHPATQDALCAPSSVHLYDQDHFDGDEICFAGDGLVQLASYTLLSNPMATWLGRVQGMEVGIEPLFIEGALAPNVNFSWFYASGFSDDIGSDLPAGMTSLVITDGFDTIGACGSGNCGYVTASNGQIVVCGMGVCPNEERCVSNSCCVSNPAAACAGRECGTVSDNCGDSAQCGSLMGACADVQRTCTSAGRCCYSQATACGASACGTASDGCGNTFTCGTCASGTSCSNGTCVGACKFHSCPAGSIWNGALCACQPNCHTQACQ